MFEYTLNKLKLFGYHGLYDEETKNGQYFYIDIKFNIINSEIINDNIKEVIDYSEIINDVEYVFSKKRYILLESLILDIKKYLKTKHSEINFSIEITKQNPITKFPLKSVGVKHT